FNSDIAGQTLDYWQTTARQVTSDPSTPADALRSYSHDMEAAANLLAAHGYDAQAEQTYRLANQLVPASPVAVAGLSQILQRTGRDEEAQQLLDSFAQKYPEQRVMLDNWRVSYNLRPTTGSANQKLGP